MFLMERKDVLLADIRKAKIQALRDLNYYMIWNIMTYIRHIA